MRRSEAQLIEMRAHWAERPSEMPDWWLPGKPRWILDRPKMNGLWHRERDLWSDGQVVWARLLLADTVLWGRGKAAGSAEVVWSPDPYVSADPDWLEGPCSLFWMLRDPPERAEGQPIDVDLPGWRELKNLVRRDVPETVQRRRFPALLSRQRVVFHQAVAVYRPLLPAERLVDPRVPLVVSGDPGRCVRLLPARFWAHDLRQTWEQAAT